MKYLLTLLATLSMGAHAQRPLSSDDLASAWHLQGAPGLKAVLTGATLTYRTGLASESGSERLPRIGLRANFCFVQTLAADRALQVLAGTEARVLEVQIEPRAFEPGRLSLVLEDGNVLRCDLDDLVFEQDLALGFSFER